MTDIWDEKPNFSDYGAVEWEEYLDELNCWLEKLKARITQIHECLGEFDGHEWCDDHCLVSGKCAQITLRVIELEQKAEKWEKLQNSELLHDIIVNASKLEAVKTWLWKNRYEKENAVTDIYKLLGYNLIIQYDRGEKEFRLEEILEAEG